MLGRQGPIALATLARPEALNAFRRATIAELLGILAEARADDSIRVLVITGVGRAFSAGADLKEMAALFAGPDAVKAARELVLSYQEVTRQMVSLPKPIIAAVNGVAVGVGCELAVASDIRLAAETATFSLAEVRRGLFETNGVTYFLPRLIGASRAAEWMLTGRAVPAQEAREAGLVAVIYPPDHLLDAALALADELAANAPISTGLVKRVLARSADLDLESVMALEVDGMLEVAGSQDLQEGLRAFAENRPPRYSGR